MSCDLHLRKHNIVINLGLGNRGTNRENPGMTKVKAIISINNNAIVIVIINIERTMPSFSGSNNVVHPGFLVIF